MDYSALMPLPVIDGHVHFTQPERLTEMLAILDAVPCVRFNLVCVPELDGSTHNPAALFFKERFPERTFISAALDYRPTMADPAHGADSLEKQARDLRRNGFDGLKLIEGKPQVRKLLPFRLDGVLYAGLWATLEQEQIPIVCHVADPDEFWDAARCPDWARQFGWDYSDGSYPAKEAFYVELEAVLNRHPRLKLILAHFGFLSNDLARAGKMLETYSSLHFDLAPHFGLYTDFNRNRAAAQAFFRRYQDRIVYGTDIDTRAMQRSSDGFRFMQSIPWFIRSFLEKDSFETQDGKPYDGLNLEADILQKVYYTNFSRLYGEAPTPSQRLLWLSQSSLTNK